MCRKNDMDELKSMFHYIAVDEKSRKDMVDARVA